MKTVKLPQFLVLAAFALATGSVAADPPTVMVKPCSNPALSAALCRFTAAT